MYAKYSLCLRELCYGRRVGSGGNQAFAFIGGGAVTAAGQIGWAIAGSDTVIRMNTGGDLAADAVIRIAGVHALGAGAFLL